MKMLYANGCSWTYGDGISEHPGFPRTHNAGIDYQSMKNYAWPAVLSNRLGCDVLNEGLAGGSNARILRTTCDFILDYPAADYKDLTVVIGWTTPDRSEVYMSHDVHPGWIRFNSAEQIIQLNNEKFNKSEIDDLIEYKRIYVSHMYHHDINLSRCIHEKFMLSNLLENLGIKYIFFDSLPVDWDLGDIPLSEYDTAINKIKNNNFIDITFHQFCMDNNIKLSSCEHPMIDGHILWADLLYKQLRT